MLASTICFCYLHMKSGDVRPQTIVYANMEQNKYYALVHDMST